MTDAKICTTALSINTRITIIGLVMAENSFQKNVLPWLFSRICVANVEVIRPTFPVFM